MFKRFSFDQSCSHKKLDPEEFIEINNKMQKILQIKSHCQEHSKDYYNVTAMAVNNSQKWLASIGMD